MCGGGLRASGMWVCGRVTSRGMCERQARCGPSLESGRFSFIANTHEHTRGKHSSAQSPSGDIGCSYRLNPWPEILWVIEDFLWQWQSVIWKLFLVNDRRRLLLLRGRHMCLFLSNSQTSAYPAENTKPWFSLKFHQFLNSFIPARVGRVCSSTILRKADSRQSPDALPSQSFLLIPPSACPFKCNNHSLRCHRCFIFLVCFFFFSHALSDSVRPDLNRAQAEAL